MKIENRKMKNPQNSPTKLTDAADALKGVRVGLCLLVEDTFAVKFINSDMAGGVDDAAVTHADAHMNDAAISILEEGQVVTLYITEADLDATGRLLRRIARQPDIQGFETDLRETRTIDATLGATTPEVRGVEETALSEVGGAIEGDILLVVHPSLITIIYTAYLRPFLLAEKHLHGVAGEELVDHLGAVTALGTHGHR